MAPAGLLEGKNKDSKSAGTTRRGEPERVRKKRTDAKEILTAALKTDFNDEEQAGAFESKYKSKWEKKSASNILCVLARKDEWEKDRSFKWTDEKTGEFLAWILKSYHTLLEVKEKTYQMSPLHLALMQDHTAFIEAVLSFPKLMNINQVLIEKGQQGNALHIAVDKTSSSLERLVQKCAQSVTMFTCKHPGTGNTPLHACMSVDLDAEINDGDSESEDGDEDGSSVASQDQSSGPSDDEDEINKSTLRLMVRGSLNQRGGQSTKILEGLSPTDKVLSAVKKLIDSHHRVLFSYNLQNRTPYQERLYQLQKANATEKGSQQTSKPGSGQDETAVDLSGLQKAIAEDQIASYIRSYCVKNFARDDVMKCLYTTGKEKHIEFDLGGLGRDTITRDYLNQLSKHLQFESILKYVALPKLAMEAPPRQKKSEKQVSLKRGRSDLVPVFQWLRMYGHVKKIVKVIVLDDQDPCHADSSIEEALNGFEVEIWDWKRLDLSTEVIRKSTKVVREISLYSTGNNAVLMGWASLEGLPNKEHFPEGYEDHKRLMENINNFKAKVQTMSDGRITVGHILDNNDVSHASEFQSSAEYLQPENPWIECLVKFSKLMENCPWSSKVRPVKIAVIDDGVDASLLSLDGKIAIGKSFCPYANSSELMSPYFVSSSNHGTCMATLICRLCPMARLYVARLDQRQTLGSNQRHVTAKSAAEAIRWATDCDVDIISMSWTIETPVPGNAEMKSLEDAVKAAESKNIVMLCSTSDQGSLTKDYCYPGDFGGCIKIGSATNTGDAMAWVNVEKVDFLTPGSNVPFSNNEGKIVWHESGSSVATAAASGLAGLLMFSSWLLNKADNHLNNSNNMKVAFKNLAADTKYPRVYERLEQRFKDVLARAEDNESRRTEDLPLTWNIFCKEALEDVIRRVNDLS
ncbi:Intracellular serine protease [Colletotrichum fructicola]|nr:Intracellular serine protease [Colletotrichum fructicola]KAF5487889.1 Intracellular serine protease [Colletotrichum fructicola]